MQIWALMMTHAHTSGARALAHTGGEEEEQEEKEEETGRREFIDNQRRMAD